jgi:hypothetical protein
VHSNVISVILQAPPSTPPANIKVMYVTADALLVEWDAVARATLYKVQVAEANNVTAGPWHTSWLTLSAFSDYASPGTSGVLRTTQAVLDGLSTSKTYAVRVVAGSLHAGPTGSFPLTSVSTPPYTPSPGPGPADVSVSVHRVTDDSITIRWSESRGRTLDPSNHSRPVFFISYRPQAGAEWLGGLNASRGKWSGCSTIVVAEGTYIGAPPGCSEVQVLSTVAGVSSYQMTFQGLARGVAHQIRLLAFTLHTPRNVRAVYTGPADACVNGSLAAGGDSCVAGAMFLFLQAPASATDGAYTGMRVRVRSGAGEGQIRSIVAYTGSMRRVTLSAGAHARIQTYAPQKLLNPLS